jgi:hypothetical protein
MGEARSAPASSVRFRPSHLRCFASSTPAVGPSSVGVAVRPFSVAVNSARSSAKRVEPSLISGQGSTASTSNLQIAAAYASGVSSPSAQMTTVNTTRNTLFGARTASTGAKRIVSVPPAT